jgi:hypothetical protein
VQPKLEALFSGDAGRDFFVGEVSSSELATLSTTRRKAVHGDEILLADSRSTLDAVFGDAGLDEEASTDDGGVKATPSAPCIHEPARSCAKSTINPGCTCTTNPTTWCKR